jgi:hypothetical protein
MHRRFLNKRVKTGDNENTESEIPENTETDNNNNNNNSNNSSTKNDDMMRVPLRRSNSSGQPGGAQRTTRSKIATISEDAPLVEATTTDIVSQDPKKRNGVRRTRSDTAKSSSNTLATMSKATAKSSSSTTTTSTSVKKGDKVRKPSTKTAAAATENGTTPVKKSVHWNHRVEKKRHHRVVDLTQEEKEAVWYTENDTKIILAMAKVTVKMMMKGEPCDDVDYCSRGLEGKTPAGSKQRQKNKLRVRKALLDEQEIQREEGIRDSEFLAEVSRKNSRDVCTQARNTAIRDEEAVRDYLGSVLTHRDSSKPPVQPRRSLRR